MIECHVTRNDFKHNMLLEQQFVENPSQMACCMHQFFFATFVVLTSVVKNRPYSNITVNIRISLPRRVDNR